MRNLISPFQLSQLLGNKLGCAPATSEFELYERLQAGFPVEAVESLVESGRISTPELRLFFPPRTWARRKKIEHLTFEESDRIARLASVIAFAEQVFGDREKAHKWLRRPNRSLHGLVPINLLISDMGSRLVVSVLGRIQHGVYS